MNKKAAFCCVSHINHNSCCNWDMLLFALNATILNLCGEPGNDRRMIATPQVLPTFVPAPSVVMNAGPALSTGNKSSGLDEDAKKRRSTLVLDVLFPNEGKVCTMYLFRAVPFLPCHRRSNTSHASSPFIPQARRKNRREFYSAWGAISCRIETLHIL
jgi:hypothetical protein